MENVNINTSQNVLINYKIAGIGDRIIAQIIDSLIIVSYYILMAFLLGITVFSLNDFSWIYFIFFLPVVFYHLLFEIFMEGQTPGKKSRNIKVVKLDGTKAGVSNYLLRWLLSPIDFMLYGAVAILCYVTTKKGQRLGDIVAGTTVIYQQDESIHFLKKQNTRKFDDYKPTFYQAEELDRDHVELIRKVLKTNSRSHIHALAKKTKEKLQIESQEPDARFLMTLLSDYEYFMSVEA